MCCSSNFGEWWFRVARVDDLRWLRGFGWVFSGGCLLSIPGLTLHLTHLPSAPPAPVSANQYPVFGNFEKMAKW
jgi:hypothetical protein